MEEWGGFGLAASARSEWARSFVAIVTELRLQLDGGSLRVDRKMLTGFSMGVGAYRKRLSWWREKVHSGVTRLPLKSRGYQGLMPLSLGFFKTWMF